MLSGLLRVPALVLEHRPEPNNRNPNSSLASCAPLLCSADEIDAVGTKRYDAHSGGEREIQRTMLELLNQLDGFDALTDVKVGAALAGDGWGA